MRNYRLHPVYREIRTIMNDIVEPMMLDLTPLLEEMVALRQDEISQWVRHTRVFDPAALQRLELEKKQLAARLEKLQAEIERKRTCLRVFLMLVSEKIGRARSAGLPVPVIIPLGDTEHKLMTALAQIDDAYRQPA